MSTVRQIMGLLRAHEQVLALLDCDELLAEVPENLSSLGGRALFLCNCGDRCSGGLWVA